MIDINNKGNLNLPKTLESFRIEAGKEKDQTIITYTLPFMEKFKYHATTNKNILNGFSSLGIDIKNGLIGEMIFIYEHKTTGKIIDGECFNKLPYYSKCNYNASTDIDLLFRSKYKENEVFVIELKISIANSTTNSVIQRGLRQQQKSILVIKKFLEEEFKDTVNLQVRFAVVNINPKTLETQVVAHSLFFCNDNFDLSKIDKPLKIKTTKTIRKEKINSSYDIRKLKFKHEWNLALIKIEQLELIIKEWEQQKQELKYEIEDKKDCITRDINNDLINEIDDIIISIKEEITELNIKIFKLQREQEYYY